MHPPQPTEEQAAGLSDSQIGRFFNTQSSSQSQAIIHHAQAQQQVEGIKPFGFLTNYLLQDNLQGIPESEVAESHNQHSQNDLDQQGMQSPVFHPAEEDNYQNTRYPYVQPDVPSLANGIREDMHTEDQQNRNDDRGNDGIMEVIKILKQMDRNNVENFKHMWDQLEALKTHVDSLGQRVEAVDSGHRLTFSKTEEEFTTQEAIHQVTAEYKLLVRLWYSLCRLPLLSRSIQLQIFEK